MCVKRSQGWPLLQVLKSLLSRRALIVTLRWTTAVRVVASGIEMPTAVG